MASDAGRRERDPHRSDHVSDPVADHVSDPVANPVADHVADHVRSQFAANELLTKLWGMATDPAYALYGGAPNAVTREHASDCGTPLGPAHPVLGPGVRKDVGVRVSPLAPTPTCTFNRRRWATRDELRIAIVTWTDAPTTGDADKPRYDD